MVIFDSYVKLTEGIMTGREKPDAHSRAIPWQHGSRPVL